MFIDEVKIQVISGKGGDGLVSWRREKYIPKGGPWGGDGGKGGDVYLQTNDNLNTLSEYRHKKVLKADNGQSGGTNCQHGADAHELILDVPVGTIVRDAHTGEVIVDLDVSNMKYLIARGGRGGYGNAHFVSSTRQAPSFAELGDREEQKDIILELKLVADIGIIGIPSAGKSTLIGNVTNVKPKIGDYPFTTLTPNLGVLDHKGKSLVLEDVPGLIPGASEGKGLGIEFLKHIERTGVLLHLLDLYRLDQVFQDYEDIRTELGLFSNTSPSVPLLTGEGRRLSEKEEIVVFSKADLLDTEMKQYIVETFQKQHPEVKQVFVISAATGEGVEELKDFLVDNYSSRHPESSGSGKDKDIDNDSVSSTEGQTSAKVYDLKEQGDTRRVRVVYEGDLVFRATGERLEQIVRMTDFENKEAVIRVYDVLEKMGVMQQLEKKLSEIVGDKGNDFFFEGTEEEDISPKLKVVDKVIPLDNLKYNL